MSNALIPTDPETDLQYDEPMGSPSGAPSPFAPDRLLAAFRRLWWIPLLTLVLGATVAITVVLLSPPNFVSSGSMWETVKLRLPGGSLFEEDLQTFLGTQGEVLQSSTLQNLTFERLRANTNSTRIPVDKNGLYLPVKIRIIPAPKSSAFTLQASCADKAFAQAYLSTLMDVYFEYKRNIRKLISGDMLASVTEQVQKSERDLKAEQDAFATFQRSNNLAILQQEGAVAGGYLATLKTKLSDLELEARLLQATAEAPAADQSDSSTGNYASGDSLNGSSSSAAGGAPSQRDSAFKDLQILKMQREKLGRNLRPKHPKIVKLDSDIERFEKLIDVFRRQNRDQIAASLQATQLKIQSVKTSIDEWKSKVMEANGRLAEAERLKLNVDRAQTVYDRLASLVQNVGIGRNIDQETLAILEPARPAKRSYKIEVIILALGVLGGVGLGLLIIGVVVFRDDRLNSTTEVNLKLGQVIIGQVPEVICPPNSPTLPLVGPDDERHGYAESYRSLRSAILFMPPEQERPHVLLITSAVPGEGKSTIAANFAHTLALGGSRVVLVDADLRRGSLHKLLNLKNEQGLTAALENPDRVNELLQTNSLPNLSFLARGKLVSNSADLFLGVAFDQVLARLREQFDYVIIDSSPVFAADDATTLAPKVDATLFVVRSKYSRLAPVRQALDLLYQRQAKILGIVFNQADTSARSYHYYKYAEYYGKGEDDTINV